MTNKKFKTKWNLIRANGRKHEFLELNKLELNEIKLQTKENKGTKVPIRLKEFDSDESNHTSSLIHQTNLILVISIARAGWTNSGEPSHPHAVLDVQVRLIIC